MKNPSIVQPDLLRAFQFFANLSESIRCADTKALLESAINAGYTSSVGDLSADGFVSGSQEDLELVAMEDDGRELGVLLLESLGGKVIQMALSVQVERVRGLRQAVVVAQNATKQAGYVLGNSSILFDATGQLIDLLNSAAASVEGRVDIKSDVLASLQAWIPAMEGNVTCSELTQYEHMKARYNTGLEIRLAIAPVKEPGADDLFDVVALCLPVMLA